METLNFNYHPECEVYMKEGECFNCGETEELVKQQPKLINASVEAFPEETEDE